MKERTGRETLAELRAEQEDIVGEVLPFACPNPTWFMPMQRRRFGAEVANAIICAAVDSFMEGGVSREVAVQHGHAPSRFRIKMEPIEYSLPEPDGALALVERNVD